MAGSKTHDQQMRIIEERENTKNADEDFDAEKELKQPPEAREAEREGADLRKPPKGGMTDPDDRNMIRGVNQESRHHKERSDDD